ncbi:2-succinylbenzoate--CoA ligase [Coleofasciculus sp. FACHB-SPT36]|uniref:2-succinylbenzoate--CoA ligase n=1 Tax=Cyanophyceae TaxID=3028117 RepID=UPI00168B8C44|nr:2-succinylbenzoate--CoA ligase [Coleofasciculus sp. FACHB-SPT36]MBD2538325.1 2-succinylbenzoate--CoA ligase [Coleofasciculus sp. FACHB-SPT36]
MESPLDYLKKRAIDDWLIGYDSRNFIYIAEQLFNQLTPLANSENKPKILLAEREPIQFIASFIASCAAGCPVFLCNPNWVKHEWQQVFDLVQPDLIWGDCPYPLTSPSCRDKNRVSATSNNWIMIPTGGSSGQIRFAIHTWKTLMASVQGFRQYFQINPVNSFCVLPLYHVSGLMQFMRSFTSGGRLAIVPFKELESSEKCEIDPSEFFLSLVPTQLQRLLHNPDLTAWLSRFQTVLLGGAPAWIKLLEEARRHSIRLAPTYGMTETASQIATLKPEYFLNGTNNCGQILPHAKVTICSSSSEILEINQVGTVTIKSGSLTLGYYPEKFLNQQHFQVDDLGFIDEQGNLNIIGRSSNKIITGGENVFPSEVEAAIQATGLVADVCVIGLPDSHWGQIVTAVYVPSKSDISTYTLQIEIEDKLSKFKRPKYWVPVETLPRNTQGKVNREQLQRIAYTRVFEWQYNEV